MKLILSRRNCLGALLVLLTIANSSFGQTSTFTYQGRLTDGGTPPTGTYDFQFKLYDALTDGNQLPIGSPVTVTKSAVLVTNGVFTVQLDFGVSGFPGADRFLDIGVKHPADGSYTPLSPRQQLTAAPYALRTLTATSADALSSACVLCISDAQIQAVNGSKVTGTVANAANAATATNVSGIVQIGNGGTGSSTQNFVDLSTNQNNIAGNKSFIGSLTVDTNTLHVDAANDRVGVGTTAPSSVLHVVGAQAPNFTNAPEVLRVVGGAGGDGSFGGKGGGVLIQGGVGGGGSEGGSGGSITLQPGGGGPGNVVGSNGVGGNVLLAPGGGSVGIGINPVFVASTSNSLYIGNDEGDVFNHFRLDGFANNLYIVAKSSFPSASGAGIIFRTATASTGETDHMAITPAGKVAIGTSAPLAKLHVRDFSSADGSPIAIIESSGTQVPLSFNSSGTEVARIRADNGGQLVFATVGGQSRNIYFRAGDDIGTEMFIESSTSNVGIGTTAPEARLHVGGGAILLDNNQGLFLKSTAGAQKRALIGTASNILRVGSVGPSGFDEIRFDLGALGGTAMTLSPSGNVGVGTTAPNFKLHVNGMVAGVGPYVDASDLRYKRDIRAIDGALSKVLSLRGVTFDWRREEFPALDFTAGRSVGFVAQEVERVVPEAVTRDAAGFRSVAYSHLTPVLVEAVKEQQQAITELRAQNSTLDARLKEQQALMQHQLSLIEQLQKSVERQELQITALKKSSAQQSRTRRGKN